MCVVALCKPEHMFKGDKIASRCLPIHRKHPELSRKSVPAPKRKNKRARPDSGDSRESG